jgi:TolB-like protein/AraC-like DNA-binding protein/Flp pilus assembly protein TadD
MKHFDVRTPKGKRATSIDPDEVARRAPIPRDLKKAVDYIRTHLAGKMSVADLIACCDVPERTLRKHFRAFMATSPLEFWRHLRLAAARECFLEGSTSTSVTEVAIRFGFDHFGRFAQHYRDRFAETPTATLQRSRSGKRDTNQRRSEGRNVPKPKNSRDRPSIAVLPLQSSGASNDCKAIGKLIAEGIATALCRARSVSIIAANCAFVRSTSVRQTGFHAGARYLLVGRVAQEGNSIRVLVRLLDAENEAQLWGDIFDGQIKNLFELADHVIESVVRAVLVRVRDSEIERAQRGRPEDLAAHALTMRAFPFVFAANPAAAQRALDILYGAIEREPDYAVAISLAAWCHAQLVLYNGALSVDRERQNALRLSERAGILDPDDPMVLTARCAVHTMAGQLDHASALISRALELDPALVWSWERSGWLNAYAGNAKTAIEHFEQATRRDARRPNASRLTGLGCAYFDAGQYKEAARWKRLALQEDVGTAWINRTLSVSYLRLGDRRAALESLEALRRYSADISITRIVSSLPFQRDFLDRVAEGLDDLGLSA